MASYINNVDGAEPINGKERSTLRLYENFGIYTVDSVFITSSGNKAKYMRYSIIGIKDYEASRGFSIYYNVPSEYAYFEEYNKNIDWDIDLTKAKTILGLKCHYAFAKIGADSHEIWFSNELPYKDGPFLAAKKYNKNLPGLVLEHTMGNGYTTTAVNIDFIKSSPNLCEKINKLKSWEKTQKPSLPPQDPDSSGHLLINQDIATSSLDTFNI